MMAFQGTVYARTVSTYDANGNPLATIRLTNAAAFTAPQYKTAYLYGTSGEAFGQLVATTSETGGITWSDYDQHGRVIATWQGSALGDPPAAGAPGGDMVLVAETFYDQATPGAGA
ncbi:MAG: hypothetical protein NT031_12190, partial [Planctomycetota bacterium]|nr:hypothetical protein [Planctomycetota bacterium]